MRVLLCQTPRLTYVQAIELLQRETLNGGVDLILFPEMAIEHPPQCTGQGDLTFENVALLMLSRFCKSRRMYLVLGSVEERDNGCLYDTCVVLNREGELLYQYRKRSSVLIGRSSGAEPGIFDSEFGPIGILMGAEIEEEGRWHDLLMRKPYLVLNPARAPMQLDPVLIHTHPELQISAWHKSLNRLEHIVETKTRQCACSFVRADAPFQDGGAGTSILVEPHRSVLAPRWGAAFFVVDTMHPYELEGRKLPGWRQLSIDERARLATHDRALLTQEEIERGPRYLVWTLRPTEKGNLRSGLHSWNNSAAQREKASGNMDVQNLADGVVNIGRPGAFLVPLTARDGHRLYATITVKGSLLIWDVKLKRELSSSMVGATGLTAVAPWQTGNQLIIASSARGMTTLKVFEEHAPISEIRLDESGQVHKHRRSSLNHRKLPGTSPHHRVAHHLPVPGKRAPPVKALFHVQDTLAVVVLEAESENHQPTAMLVDMEEGKVQIIDVYGNGPPLVTHDASDSEDSSEEVLKGPSVDQLVRVNIVEHHVRGRLQRVLVCLYDSNRLVQCVLGMNDPPYEYMLLEEGAGERQRTDSPVSCAVFPNLHSDTFHLVASYQSMYLRWWLVSFTSGKLQSQLTLTSVITHLAIIDWPAGQLGTSACISPTIEKPPGVPSAPKRGGTRFSTIPTREKGNELGRASVHANARQSVRMVTQDQENNGGHSSLGQHRASVLAPLSAASCGAFKSRLSVRSGGNSRQSRIHHLHAQRHSVLSSQVAPAPADNCIVPKDQACLCIVAFDAVGGMPIFLARAGRIAKVYTCSDHFNDKSVKLDNLICDGINIAAQISNGDVRHLEFVCEDETIPLKDIPMDFPA